jgi:hypothetical protein
MRTINAIAKTHSNISKLFSKHLKNIINMKIVSPSKKISVKGSNKSMSVLKFVNIDCKKTVNYSGNNEREYDMQLASVRR